MVKYVVLALVVLWTAVSLPVGLAIWPPAAGSPPAQVLPIFAIVSLFEGAAFGFGAAFLVFGGRLLAAVGRWTRLTSAAYLSIAWLLMNWWPHDGLHRSGFGQTFGGLAAIDVVFHTTLIVGAVIVMVFFLRAIRPSSAARGSQPTAEPAIPAV